jgi:hypothetical protein
MGYNPIPLALNEYCNSNPQRYFILRKDIVVMYFHIKKRSADQSILHIEGGARYVEELSWVIPVGRNSVTCA